MAPQQDQRPGLLASSNRKVASVMIKYAVQYTRYILSALSWVGFGLNLAN